MKRFSGWSCTVGSCPARGIFPSSTEGTEKTVFSWTFVAFGYHVPLRAKRAKFGKRPASMRSSSSISICTGNASKVTTTSGGLELPRASHTRVSPDVTRLEAFDVKRKRKPNRIGASPSTEQIERSPAARA